MTEAEFLTIRVAANRRVWFMKGKVASLNRLASYQRVFDEAPPEFLVEELEHTAAAFDKWANAEMKIITRILDNANDPAWLYAKATPALGAACAFLMGLLPKPLAEWENPAKVWRYLGLAVEGGKRQENRKKGEERGFSPFKKSVAIAYIANSVIKKPDSPYGLLYHARRAWTETTHPECPQPGCPTCDQAAKKTKSHRDEHEYERERTAIGFDCSHFGGPHWSKGHRHKDALRYVAKAIVRDLWLVAHGKEPRVSDNRSSPVPEAAPEVV